MKLALVYDRVNKWGGAERVLLALHEIWPEAPLFTAVYDKKRAAWADVFQIKTSFLQYIPFAKNHHEFFPWLTPMAFESFDFSGYDVVLSVTSAEAKDVITKPETVHICYCLTPTRYLWSGEAEYEKAGFSGAMLKILAPLLKKWDIMASKRPDYYIAISKRVGDRIKKYYKRTVEKVIYPPVDLDRFTVKIQKQKTGKYFLCVSRLVPYKRVDLVIQAFNELGWDLKIAGSGSQEKKLRKLAKKNIEFLGGDLTDSALAAYYQECSAFVAAGEEDFGIVALEAQACGKPVICPRRSGMAETVIEGKTGELFDTDLMSALHKFRETRYDSDLCKKNAEKFSRDRFKKEMKVEVEKVTKTL
jgi:glycosyltransferase involved in cell wall biosynthesis